MAFQKFGFAFAALALSTQAYASGTDGLGLRIVTQGSPSGAPACVACHGSQLHGTPSLKAPAIAGRPSAFILARLAHYAGPQGHNAAMKQVATTLTPAEQRALAAYLSSLKP